jgi:prevent-host-death family protein
MQTISVSELRQNLSLYLEKVKDGDEIIIEDKSEVIARILPFDENDEEKFWLNKAL